MVQSKIRDTNLEGPVHEPPSCRLQDGQLVTGGEDEVSTPMHANVREEEILEPKVVHVNLDNYESMKYSTCQSCYIGRGARASGCYAEVSCSSPTPGLVHKFL